MGRLLLSAGLPFVIDGRMPLPMEWHSGSIPLITALAR